MLPHCPTKFLDIFVDHTVSCCGRGYQISCFDRLRDEIHRIVFAESINVSIKIANLITSEML